MEETHFMADGAIALSEADRWCWTRGAHFGGIHLGAVHRVAKDRGWETEFYGVFCEAAVAGAFVGAAG